MPRVNWFLYPWTNPVWTLGDPPSFWKAFVKRMLREEIFSNGEYEGAHLLIPVELRGACLWDFEEIERVISSFACYQQVEKNSLIDLLLDQGKRDASSVVQTFCPYQDNINSPIDTSGPPKVKFLENKSWKLYGVIEQCIRELFKEDDSRMWLRDSTCLLWEKQDPDLYPLSLSIWARRKKAFECFFMGQFEDALYHMRGALLSCLKLAQQRHRLIQEQIAELPLKAEEQLLVFRPGFAQTFVEQNRNNELSLPDFAEINPEGLFLQRFQSESKHRPRGQHLKGEKEILIRAFAEAFVFSPIVDGKGHNHELDNQNLREFSRFSEDILMEWWESAREIIKDWLENRDGKNKKELRKRLHEMTAVMLSPIP